MNPHTGEIHNIVEMLNEPQPKPLIELTSDEEKFLKLFPENPDHRTYPKAIPYRKRALTIYRASPTETRYVMASQFASMDTKHRLRLLQKLYGIYLDKLTIRASGRPQKHRSAADAKQAKSRAKKQHSRKLSKQRRKRSR